MKGTTVLLWVAGFFVVALVAYSIWGPKGKGGRQSNQASSSTPNVQAQSQPPVSNPKILTRIIKNEQGTLSLISYNADTNEIVNRRTLSFNEAVGMTGSYALVCLDVPNGKYGASYEECKSLRGKG